MSDLLQINPFAFAGVFLKFCERHKFIVSNGAGKDKKYYLTEKGMKVLSQEPFAFDIEKVLFKNDKAETI